MTTHTSPQVPRKIQTTTPTVGKPTPKRRIMECYWDYLAAIQLVDETKKALQESKNIRKLFEAKNDPELGDQAGKLLAELFFFPLSDPQQSDAVKVYLKTVPSELEEIFAEAQQLEKEAQQTYNKATE